MRERYGNDVIEELRMKRHKGLGWKLPEYLEAIEKIKLKLDSLEYLPEIVDECAAVKII